jgi:hypothetical protein
MHDSRTKSKAKIISSAPAGKFQQGNGYWEIIKKTKRKRYVIPPRLFLRVCLRQVCVCLKYACFTLHEKNM